MSSREKTLEEGRGNGSKKEERRFVKGSDHNGGETLEPKESNLEGGNSLYQG